MGTEEDLMEAMFYNGLQCLMGRTNTSIPAALQGLHWLLQSEYRQTDTQNLLKNK